MSLNFLSPLKVNEYAFSELISRINRLEGMGGLLFIIDEMFIVSFRLSSLPSIAHPPCLLTIMNDCA